MDAKVSLTVELGLRLDEVLLESELAVLEDLGEKAQNLAQQQWVGWQYKGNYPKDHQGTSFRGWTFQTIAPQGGGFIRGVAITNNATKRQRKGTRKDGKPYSSAGVGQPYARWVHRAGASVSAGSDNNREWVVVRDRIVKELIPAATKELKDQIMQNAGRNRVRKTLRADKAGGAAGTFDILTQTTL